MHHQCVAPLAANSPHSGLSRALSIASSKVRLCRDRPFFRVAIQEEWGRPTGLLHSPITLGNCSQNSPGVGWLIHSDQVPNGMSLLFCMIEVRRGCSVRRRTSQLETRWYQRISSILLRHQWSFEWPVFNLFVVGVLLMAVVCMYWWNVRLFLQVLASVAYSAVLWWATLVIRYSSSSYSPTPFSALRCQKPWVFSVWWWLS